MARKGIHGQSRDTHRKLSLSKHPDGTKGENCKDVSPESPLASLPDETSTKATYVPLSTSSSNSMDVLIAHHPRPLDAFQGIGRFSDFAPMSLSMISSSTQHQHAQQSDANRLDHRMSTGSAGGLMGRRSRRSVHELDRNFTCPEPNCTRRYEAWRSLQFHLKRNHGIVVRRINGRVELVQTGEGEDYTRSMAYAALEQQLNQLHNTVSMGELPNSRYSPESGFQTPHSLTAMDDHMFHVSDVGPLHVTNQPLAQSQPTRQMSLETTTAPFSDARLTASIMEISRHSSVDALSLWQNDTDPYTVQLQRYQQYLQLQQGKRLSTHSVVSPDSFSNIPHSTPARTTQQQSQYLSFAPSMSMPSLPTSNVTGTFNSRDSMASSLPGSSSLSVLAPVSTNRGGGLDMGQEGLRILDMGQMMSSVQQQQQQQHQQQPPSLVSECPPPPPQPLYMHLAGTKIMEADLEEIMRSIRTP